MNNLKGNQYKDTLKYKLIVSIFLILVFRILSHIPVPFVNTEMIEELSSESIFGFANLYSGGALQSYTLMATGISAYISASIIIQIATFASPKLHDLSRDASGQRRIKKMTIGLGVLIALITSVSTTTVFEQSYNLLSNDALWVYAIIAVCHAIGTGIAIAIGETITEKGFGNGVSLLIFINIATSIPSQLQTIGILHGIGLVKYSDVAICFLITLISVILVTFVESSERKIPVLYSSVAMRSDSYAKSKKSNFPMKVNIAGVMPVIFSSYILQILSVVISRIGNETLSSGLAFMMSPGTWANTVFMLVTIVSFSYIYIYISFDVHEVAKGLQAKGGAIPLVKQGKPTQEYIESVKNNLTIIGAAYLALIAIVPTWLLGYVGLSLIQSTSLIIVVGVSLETVKTLKTERTLSSSRKASSL